MAEASSPSGADNGGSYGTEFGEQRQCQPCAAPQPRARALAHVAGQRLEVAQDLQHEMRADGVAQGQRSRHNLLRRPYFAP